MCPVSCSFHGISYVIYNPWYVSCHVKVCGIKGEQPMVFWFPGRTLENMF